MRWRLTIREHERALQQEEGKGETDMERYRLRFIEKYEGKDKEKFIEGREGEPCIER